jgi:uncharacterized protein (TIGR02421 family)
MTTAQRIPADLSRAVRQTIAENRLLRRPLPGWGRVHIDRQQPFLCIYRKPPNRDDLGTDTMLLSQASYVLASGHGKVQASLRALIKGLITELANNFGRVVLLELWSANTSEAEPDASEGPRAPVIRIVAPAHAFPQSTLESMEGAFTAGEWAGGRPEILLHYERNPAPPGLPSILTVAQAEKLKCDVLGLEIPPIYRMKQEGPLIPDIARSMRRDLGHVLKQTFFSFSHSEAAFHPAHYHELGQRAVTRAVYDVDRKLSEIGDAFDLLLLLTPTNADAAWNAFRRNRFQAMPQFHYRPRTVDPASLKQQLYRIPLDRVEDPALHAFFEGKRDELDRQISMVGDRGTQRVLYGSLQVFGAPDTALVNRAGIILGSVPPHAHDDISSDFVDARTFASHAEAELSRLKKTMPGFAATVQIRDDVPGLMVSKGHLLIGHTARVAKSRIEATIQHEIGTHILTYYNGQSQPFRLLHTGSAGYEELQEGLAVLAEFLVGGLSRPRLRILAGRVLAVDYLVRGADFAETYRLLHDDHGFSQQTAYTIAMRVYRGGGLSKDIVYLRGLTGLLDRLAKGIEFTDLLVGKIAFDDLPVVEELVWRKVLKPATLRPAYLDDSKALAKLQRIASAEGFDIRHLIEEIA